MGFLRNISSGNEITICETNSIANNHERIATSAIHAASNRKYNHNVVNPIWIKIYTSSDEIIKLTSNRAFDVLRLRYKNIPNIIPIKIQLSVNSKKNGPPRGKTSAPIISPKPPTIAAHLGPITKAAIITVTMASEILACQNGLGSKKRLFTIKIATSNDVSAIFVLSFMSSFLEKIFFTCNLFFYIRHYEQSEVIQCN